MHGDSKYQRASAYVVFASGDAGTAKDLLTMNTEQVFRSESWRVDYDNAGTAEATVEIWDAPEGTTQANLSSDARRQMDNIHLSPGDFESFDFEYEDFENDVVIVVNANDDEVTVATAGKLVT